jgi:VCBS repeat-containing protein
LVYLNANLLSVGTSPVTFDGSFVLNGGVPAATEHDGTVSVTGVGIVHPTDETWVLKNNVFDVTVDDMGDGVVYSWEATFTYDPAIISITDIITDGTLSAGGATQVNLLTPGLVTIASVYSQTINGGGVLFKIATTAVGVGVSPLTWTSFQINTGIPPGVLVDGSITVKPNPPAVAIDGVASVNEDESVDVTLTATDEDNDVPLTFAIATPPAHGTAVLNGDVVTYSPDANYNGADSFTFTVFDGEDVSLPGTISITVFPVNDAPTTLDVTGETDEDTSALFTLLGDDIDGDALTYFVVDAPAHGAVVINGATATYTPSQDFNGSDSFTYWVADPDGATSNVSTVSITVHPVNDAPVAVDMTLEVDEDNTLVVTLDGYDVDGDALTYHVTDGPQHGELSLEGGVVTYTPDANYFGPDSFKFHLNDGLVDSNIATASITVLPVNDAPVALADAFSTAEDTELSGSVAGNDTDTEDATLAYSVGSAPAHGTLALQADGSFVYMPTADFNGMDTFTYVATDSGSLTSSATVTVTVTPVADAPVSAM